MKKAFFSFILLVLAAIFYLFWTDLALVKKLIGNKVPTPSESPAVVYKEELDFLSMPEGFKISVIAKDLENPRVILFDAKGRLLVSETKAGRVSVLEDANKDGSFENKRALIDNLKAPHGLDFYKDEKNITYLYIAETQQVARYPYDVNA